MMMEYAGKSSDVSDPWYTGDFERTYRDIAEGCEGLLRQLSAGSGFVAEQ
jgi:protein-tyrosine phosphatase